MRWLNLKNKNNMEKDEHMMLPDHITLYNISHNHGYLDLMQNTRYS